MKMYMRSPLSKDLLLDRYEWSGGLTPSPKENKERLKEVRNGTAKVAENENDFLGISSTKRKIQRKV